MIFSTARPSLQRRSWRSGKTVFSTRGRRYSWHWFDARLPHQKTRNPKTNQNNLKLLCQQKPWTTFKVFDVFTLSVVHIAWYLYMLFTTCCIMLSVMYVLIVVITTGEHWCHYGIFCLLCIKNGVYAEPSHGVTWEKLKAWKLLTNVAPCGRRLLWFRAWATFWVSKCQANAKKFKKAGYNYFFCRNLAVWDDNLVDKAWRHFRQQKKHQCCKLLSISEVEQHTNPLATPFFIFILLLSAN